MVRYPLFMHEKKIKHFLCCAPYGVVAVQQNIFIFQCLFFRVFGHFEQGVFFKLCKHAETVHLRQGELLFEVGQTDKWLYVVQEGQINLYIHDKDTEVLND